MWSICSSRGFVEDHREEITALQVLYSRPYQGRLRAAEP